MTSKSNVPEVLPKVGKFGVIFVVCVVVAACVQRVTGRKPFVKTFAVLFEGFSLFLPLSMSKSFKIIMSTLQVFEIVYP